MNPAIFNLLWGLLFCAINFSMVLVAHWLFGRTGLFVWIAIATIIANIQVVKTIDLFGYAATLGNVFYGSIFLATDILNEKYGKREANRSVMLGFFSDLALIVAMQMALIFIPLEGVDIAQGALKTIFGLVPRICLGSLAAYLFSQFLDIVLFCKLKAKTKGRYVWLRNNAATMVSQLFDTAIFVLISFSGLYDWMTVLEIFTTTYILKAAVAIFDTPFLYAAKRLKPGILVGETRSVIIDKLRSRFKKNGASKKDESED